MSGLDLEESSSSDEAPTTNIQPECYAYLRSLKSPTEQKMIEPCEPGISSQPGPSGTNSGGENENKSCYKKKKHDEKESDEDTMVSAFKYICLDGKSLDAEKNYPDGKAEGAEPRPSTSLISRQTQTETQPESRVELFRGGDGETKNPVSAPPLAPALPPLRRWRPLDGVMSNTLFSKLVFCPDMGTVMKDFMGITTATILQEKTIPILMNEKDAIIQARPGTGKTLAFAIPIIHHLTQIKPKVCTEDGIRAIVIVPTKESVTDTYDMFKNLNKPVPWIVVGQVGGGQNFHTERQMLRKGITILIATPNRLSVLLRHTCNVVLRNVSHLIVDGLDEMYANNHQKNLADIVAALNNGLNFGLNSNRETNSNIQQQEVTRQTVIITADLTEDAMHFAGLHTTEPMLIKDFRGTCPARITIPPPPTPSRSDLLMARPRPPPFTQYYMITPEGMRTVALIAFIMWKSKIVSRCKMVIYIGNQSSVSLYADWVKKAYGVRDEDAGVSPRGYKRKACGLEVFQLNSSFSPYENNKVIDEFSKSRFAILFCKDRTAASLVLPRVDWIIQFTPPTTVSNYAARVGITDPTISARSSLLFLVPSEKDFVDALRDREVPIRNLRMRKCFRYLWSMHPSTASIEKIISDIQLTMKSVFDETSLLRDRAYEAYGTWCRSYSRYPRSMRHIFDIRNIRVDRYAKSFGIYERPNRMFSYASLFSGVNSRVWIMKKEEEKRAKAIEAEKREAEKRKAAEKRDSTVENPDSKGIRENVIAAQPEAWRRTFGFDLPRSSLFFHHSPLSGGNPPRKAPYELPDFYEPRGPRLLPRVTILNAIQNPIFIEIPFPLSGMQPGLTPSSTSKITASTAAAATKFPAVYLTTALTTVPSAVPSFLPTIAPSIPLTSALTAIPTVSPSTVPTISLTTAPTAAAITSPTTSLTIVPTAAPTDMHLVTGASQTGASSVRPTLTVPPPRRPLPRRPQPRSASQLQSLESFGSTLRIMQRRQLRKVAIQNQRPDSGGPPSKKTK